MSNNPFGPCDSFDSYESALNEAREIYLDAVFIAESTFQLSPDWTALAQLFETQPARASLTTAKRVFDFGAGIVAKVLEHYNSLISDFLRNENADPVPVLQSLASIQVALEMHSLELTGYKMALAYCKLVDEVDSDEYDALLKDTLRQTAYIADVTALAKASADQFLAAIEYRKAN